MARTVGCLLLTFVAAVVFSSTAVGQTVTAKSCSASDVQAAFDSVTSSTTMVAIPACGSGGVTWTSPVTLSVPSGNTSLTIEGQGLCTPSGTPGQSNYSLSCDDASEIIDGDTNDNENILTIRNVTGFLRITGLTIANNSSSVGKNNGSVGIGGNSTQLRIDHNHLVDVNDTGRLVQIGGCIDGVIDHNLAEGVAGNDGSLNFFRLYNAGSCYNDPIGQGDESWAHPTGLGSSNFMFLEDNVIRNGFGDDCSQGGRMVWRYNNFSETGTASGIQTHATGASVRWRGCRAWEIYHNYFYPGDNVGEQPPLYLTAGTGVIWDNTVVGVSSTQGFKGLAAIHNSRNGTIGLYGQTATPNGWGYCGTAKDGVGSNWDQNSNALTGYRCLDQVGAGQSDLLSGNFPNITNVTTGCAAGTFTPGQTCAWAANALEPVYEWGNFWNNTLGWTGLAEFGGEQPFTKNQDYYLWCDPSATTGCTSAFNGTQGVGSGPLSARPITCTPGPGTNVPGVGYWATNQNTLYVCENNGSSNVWVSYYSPYQYPHPLDTADQLSGGPAAPTNLQASVN